MNIAARSITMLSILSMAICVSCGSRDDIATPLDAVKFEVHPQKNREGDYGFVIRDSATLFATVDFKNAADEYVARYPITIHLTAMASMQTTPDLSFTKINFFGMEGKKVLRLLGGYTGSVIGVEVVAGGRQELLYDSDGVNLQVRTFLEEGVGIEIGFSHAQVSKWDTDLFTAGEWNRRVRVEPNRL